MNSPGTQSPSGVSVSPTENNFPAGKESVPAQPRVQAYEVEKNIDSVNTIGDTGARKISDNSLKTSEKCTITDKLGCVVTTQLSVQQEYTRQPSIRSSCTFELTRKRSHEKGEDTCNSTSVSSAVTCQTSLNSHIVLRRPSEKPIALLPPRVTAGRQIKRPNSLPIPTQTSSPKPVSAVEQESGTSTTTLPSEWKSSPSRTIASGRRVLQSSLYLRDSISRSIPDAQRKPSSWQANELTWEPVSTKEIGTRIPSRTLNLSSPVCLLCSTRFSLIRQPQHCRACGRIVCANCLRYHAPLPFLNPTVDLEKNAGDGVGGSGGDDGTGCPQKLMTSSAFNAHLPSFQRSFSCPDRCGRVCEPCYCRITTSPTKQQVNMLIQPPSPKRQCSISPSSTKWSPALCKPYEFVINVSDVELKQSASYRCEDLLHPTSPAADEKWPPLVVGLHAELELRFDPPQNVILNLISSEESQSVAVQHPNMEHRSVRKSHDVWPYPLEESSTERTDCPSAPLKPPRYPSPVARVSSGVTLALTRNVHVHVHATELNCCLRKSAWCFASSGLQSFGQQEVVLLVRRRAGEQLPPLNIYRFYQQLYLAVSQQQSSEADARGVISLPPSHQPLLGLFRPYDTFIPTQWFGQSRHREHECTTQTPSNNSTRIPFGCLFFHPTHQCLNGLRLPTTPFLVGLLFHQVEEYWAKYLPLRLLLRLGKSTRYYPTPLLCDLDRQSVFDADRSVGVLPWLPVLTTPPSSSALDPVETADKLDKPTLLLRVPGLQIRLVSLSGSDSRSSGAKLELFFPAGCHTELIQFLDTLPPSCTGFALAGDLNQRADSHLVCVQADLDCSDLGENLTPVWCQPFKPGAISIANTARAITGASFAAFLSDTRFTTVSIVEDGVFVQLSHDAFSQLVHSLLTSNNVRFEVPSVALKNSLVSCITVKWCELTDHNSSVSSSEANWESWIDMRSVPAEQTYLVPPSYQLMHWLHPGLWLPSSASPDMTPDSPGLSTGLWPATRLAWARLHVLEPTTAVIRDTRTGSQFNLAELANQACEAVVQSLRPHVVDLRRQNHTQLAVRIQLKPPDLVGYQVTSLHTDLDALVPNTLTSSDTLGDVLGRTATAFSPSPDLGSCSFNLERYLTPAMQSWLSWMQFDSGPSGSPASSVSSLSSAARTPTGTDNARIVTVATNSMTDSSMQLVIELDFYLLD